jgi:phospholipase/carboxylesterase
MTGAVEGWEYGYAPAAGADALVLLMLHGTGGDERRALALGRALAPRGAAVLAPRGRVSERGMARYFSRTPEDPFRYPDFDERIDELAGFVRAALAAHDLAGLPVYGVGASNGANAATGLIIRHPGLLAGAVLLRGLLPAPVPPGRDLSGVAVLSASGRRDGMVPATMTADLVRELRTHGAEVTVHQSPGGHGLDDGDLEAAARWLAARARAA